MPSSRQVGRISSSMPREISEYSICRSAIGWTACARRERLGADFRQADVAHVAGLDQVGDGADRVLDRHRSDRGGRGGRCRCGRCPAAAACRQTKFLVAAGPGVDADPAPVGPAQRAVLDADHDLVAIAALERLGDQHLVVAHAVVVAGVEQRDAGVERGVDGGDAFDRGRPGRRRRTCPCSRGRGRRRSGRSFRGCG